MSKTIKEVLNNKDLLNYIYSYDPTYKNLYNECINQVGEISINNIYKNICKNLIDKYIYPTFLLNSYIFDRIIWMHDGYYNHTQWYGKNNIKCINCECIFIKPYDNQYIEIIFNNVYYDPNNDIYTCDDYNWIPIKVNNTYNHEYIEFILDY